MNYIGLLLGLASFVIFFKKLGVVVSIRDVFAVLMCLQFLISPFMVYNGLEEYVFYKMKVSEQIYFNYVTPAMGAFLLGLYFGWKKKHFEYRDIRALQVWFTINSQIPYIFIGVGFLASFGQSLVSGEFGFLLYLIGSLKFIGLLLLLLATETIPLKITLLIIGSIVVSSFVNVMFHDLFIWSILSLTVLAFKKQFSMFKKLAAVVLISCAGIFVQSIKGDLREKSWQQGEEMNLDLVEESYNDIVQEKGGLFTKENLAPHITRINQGWIIASIMDNVPNRVPFANGETILQYIEAALLPRFLAPNKLNSGDKEIFNKYSGHVVSGSTSMALSSVGDAYINYGVQGGWVFMFVYGLIFNLIIRYFVKLSDSYPTAYVFSFLILFYTIRPDCELQTTLGHLVKTSLLLLILFRSFGKYFRIRSLAEAIQG